MLTSFLSSVALLCATVAASAVPPTGPFGKLNHAAKVGSHGHVSDDQIFTASSVAGQKGGKAAKDTSGYRFYNSKSAPYLVNSLPDVPFTLDEFYAGNLPIKAGDASRQLFFIYQPTVGAPVNELTIWFNGGPGCSSLEGFFQENGLFVWKEGTNGVALNPLSWVNQTNMLWIEQPVGVGYSIGTPTATSEEEIAQDIIGFLSNFQSTFGISNYKTYVTGESYAGRYVPYVASAILDQTDKSKFNLGGAIIYDGCIGAFTSTQEQVPTYPFVKANNNFFKFPSSYLSQIATQHKTCGYDSLLTKYLTFPPPAHQPAVGARPAPGCDIFNSVYQKAQNINSCFNIYEINQTCPGPVDPMADNIFAQPDGTKTNYFNRDDVKAALHAPASAEWSECTNKAVFIGGGGRGGPQAEGDLSADPIQHVLPKIIEATKRVLVINGDYDFVIMTNGSLLAIQNMTWGGQLGFQTRPTTPINIGGVNHGVQHAERGLLWAETYKTGHMGPEYDSEASLRHLEWMRGTIEAL